MTKPKVIATLAVVAVLIISIPFVADFISSIRVREVQSSILSVCFKRLRFTRLGRQRCRDAG